MNELQIKLTGDITALISTLKKAKAEIKSFESETDKESEKANAGLKRKAGLIEKLTNDAKRLRVALSQATSEEKIIEYNQALEETQKSLTRLNSLGRQVTASLGSTSGGFGQMARQGSNANGVVMEFNRVIQDAPFGLMGIGNNIQQLAGNFAVLKAQSGSASAALKASLGGLMTSTNLVLLGISAVTAAFTAYQMGAFDFATATDDATKAQDEFNESLKDTEQTLKEGFFNELLKAQGLLKTENLGGRLVDVPAFQTAQEVLEKLGSTINSLNKNELEALESFLSQRLADAARASANATTELEKSLAGTDVLGYEKVLAKVNEQLKFYEDDTKKSTKATKELKQEINAFSTDPLIDAYFKAIEAGVAFRKSIDQAAGGVVLDDPIIAVQNQIAQSLSQMGLPEKETADIAENLKNQKSLVDELSGAYAGLGSVIGKAFDNPQFGSFLGQFIPFVAKVISGLFAVSTANAVAGATQSSLFTGPAAVFTLPAFIATAVGLVAGAFSSLGAGGGGSGGGGGAVASSGAPPQIFTNKNTVTPPNQNSPNYNPGSDIDWSKAQGKMYVDFDYDKIRVGIKYNEEVRQSGG